MAIAAAVCHTLGGLLLLHLTLLPLLHGRAVLWYGREALLATLALVAGLALSLWATPAAVIGAAAGGAVLVVGVAVLAGPWLVFGASADAVASGARRAASMVRARYEADEPGRRVRIGGAATLRIVPLLPWCAVVILTGRRTPKVRLWRNVFRKQVQNHHWRVA